MGYPVAKVIVDMPGHPRFFFFHAVKGLEAPAELQNRFLLTAEVLEAARHYAEEVLGNDE